MQLNSIKYISKLSGSCAMVLVMATMQNAANAQVVVPGAADPGRIEERFGRDSAPSQNIAPTDIEQSGVTAPEGADEITFVLNELIVEDSEVYSTEKLQTVYGQYIGEEISLTTIYEIAEALTLKFREDGYIITQVIVPPQTIDDGIVRLRVVEGFIDGLSVLPAQESPLNPEQNQRAYALAEAYLAEAVNQRPLNMKDLERGLLLIDDLSGVSARAVMSESQTNVGGSNLSILLSHDPYEALLAADNYGSRFLGPAQFTGLANLNSGFGWGEQIQALAVFAPDDNWQKNLAFGSLRMRTPIADNGLWLDVRASHSNTSPGFTLEQFGVEGRSTNIDVGVRYPWIRSRDVNLYSTFDFSAAEIRSDNVIDNERNDDVRMLRFGLEFDWQDAWFGLGSASFGTFEVSKGVDVLGGSRQDDVNLIRPDADPEATKLTASLGRLQNLTNTLRLSTFVQGQFASQGLVSSEEFGVGGIFLGRGYDPSEITGDQGVAGQVELQWQPQSRYIQTPVELFAFYDIGRVWNDDPANNAEERDSLSSTGFGARFRFLDNVNLDTTFAVPLTRDIGTYNSKSTRLFVRLQKSF